MTPRPALRGLLGRAPLALRFAVASALVLILVGLAGALQIEHLVRDRQDVGDLVRLLGGGMLLVWLLLCGLGWLLSRRLRAELKHSSHLAHHDVLTGLPNRARWAERLTSALGERREPSGLAVLLMDLDGFKDVNDLHGHAVGDELLNQIAVRLRRLARPEDTVARLGGDEFALLLTGLEPADAGRAADLVASRISTAFSEPFALEGERRRIAPSVGIAVLGRDGDSYDQLMRRADAAMYAAKRRGGGAATYDALRDDAGVRLQLLEQLRVGIGRGELRLHHQPSVRLADGVVTGTEALVRWQHPTRGLLAPDAFLPVIERSELMAPLTDWVLNQAVQDCARWRADGHDLCVAVNLSACSVLDPSLPQTVTQILTRHGLPADCLAFEITETSLIERWDEARAVLGELSGLGTNIAIDDFGTGYASLAWLRQLPFNALKIDRDFVADVTTGGVGAELVRYTVQLAHAMGKVVVAEGIETEAQYRALVAMGADHGQGFGIARPMPADTIAEWLCARAAGRQQALTA